MRRRLLRATRFTFLLGILVAVLAGVLAVGLIWSLRLSIMQQQVGYLVTRFAKKAGVFFVRAENVTGNLPWQLHVDKVEIGDKDDVYITIEDAEVTWHPFELWQPGAYVPYRIVVDHVHARRLTWTRLPETIDEPDDKPFRWDRFPRIVVEALEVDEFVVTGTLLDGHTAVMKAKGRGVLGEWDQGRLDLSLERIDGRRGTAHIDLHTSGFLSDAPTELRGTVVASEEEGGALVNLARIGEAGAVELSVTGSGLMRDWRGRADVTTSYLGKLGLDAHIAFGPTGAFDGSGRFEPVPLVRMRSLLPESEEPIDFSARGAWVPDQEVRLDDVDVVVGGRTIDARGRLDLVTDLFTADATLDHQDDASQVVLRWLDLASARAHAEGKIGDGGELRGELDVTSAVSGVASASMLRGRVTARDPVGEGPPAFDLTVDGEGLEIADETAALLGETARLTASGTADLADGIVIAPSVVVTGKDVRIEGPVDVGDDWGSVRGDLVATSSDLSSLENLTGLAVRGDASLSVKGSLHESGAVQLQLGGGADNMAVDEPGWDALLGPRLTLTANASGNLSGPFQARADLGAEGVTARATASMAEHGGELRADLSAVIDNLSRLSDPLAASIAGYVVVDATARGALDDFALDASVRGERIVFSGTRLDVLTVDARGDGLPDRLAGDLDVYARYGDLETRLSGKASMPAPQRLVLSQVAMTGPSTSATIDLDIDLAGEVASGRIVGSSGDLALWRPFAGRGIGGSLSVDVGLGTTSQAGKPVQLVGGKVVGEKIAFVSGDQEVLANLVDVTAEGVEIGPSPRGSWKLSLAGARVGTTVVRDALVTATGDGRVWNIGAAATGSAAGELSMDAAATLAGNDGKYEANVSRLDATLADQPLALAAPAVLAWTDTSMSLAPTTFRVGDGTLVASIATTPAKVEADADLRRVPLAVASAFVDGLDLRGVVSGTLDVRGSSLETAWAEAKLEGTGVGSGVLEKRGVATVDVAVDGRFASGRLAAEGSLVGLTDTTLSVSVDAPLGEEAGAGEGVHARLRWHGDIAEAASLLPLDEDVLKGRIDADLVIGGTVRAPRVSGSAAISGGSYENGATGLVLRDLDVSLVGEGGSLVLSGLQATDGDDGRITASGRLDFGELPAFALAIDAVATRAMLTRLDLLTTRADATIAVRASRTDADADVGGSITGEVSVDEARVQIPTEFAETVPDLAVVEVHGTGVAELAAETKQESSVALDLDVAVHADNRIFVEGRSLESEWKADLKVKGTSARPLVEGTVESVRGQLGLLGRRFSFRNATLRFDGTDENVPYLNMTAEAEAHDITAIVDVRGPATKPVVELRSEPALPRDEVLSRVLFGESAGDLTPMQSVQLARSVAELTGRPLFGGGSGLLGRVGRGLGLDSLGLETGEGGGGALSATKYLTDNVYLRFQQGLTPEDSKAVVEWEIFNNVTIESDISEDAEGEIGVNWKWDY